MNLLVLGGTKFLGRAIVETALARGHALTLFTRGRTNPELFPEAEHLHGDRATDLSALAGRRFDAVVDTSGYVPRDVLASATALQGSPLYLFVSSISVYDDLSTGPDETGRTATLDPAHSADELRGDLANYGPLKALCEQEAQSIFGERALIVRPGLIVGPYDPTGRFTYWPHRFHRGGDVVVPAPPDDVVQFVDVRDLGAWLVDLCERGEGGVYNATGTGTSWRELAETCRAVTGSDARLVWVPGEFLAGEGVGEWMELPLWLHDPTMAGLHRTDVSRALAAGLSFRPLAETVADTLAEAKETDGAGLDPEREARLLTDWRNAA